MTAEQFEHNLMELINTAAKDIGPAAVIGIMEIHRDVIKGSIIASLLRQTQQQNAQRVVVPRVKPS